MHFVLKDRIRAGDQIMVATETGNWHHGIYVGYQAYEGQKVALSLQRMSLTTQRGSPQTPLS
jgi:hypothetical protein